MTEDINGIRVRDFYRIGTGKLRCIATCVDCKEEREVFVSTLKHGRVQRCRSCAYKTRKTTKTHGMRGHRLYGVWANILSRCTNPNIIAYRRYGGRGIQVCTEWRDFAVFLKWSLANGYSHDLLIDRIDNDGNYEPSNCRWTTREVQNCNTCRIRVNNTSGFRGVSCHGKKWKAQIGVSGKNTYIGIFDTPKEAAEEYDAFVIAEGLEHTLNFKRMAI